MLNIRPKRLRGPWLVGYALDDHTLHSEFVGYDDFGHERFETQRSDVGERLYRLKYKNDDKGLDDLVVTVCTFLLDNPEFSGRSELIVPVPPSNTTRCHQPVFEIFYRAGQRIGLSFEPNGLTKAATTPQLKEITDPAQRRSVLAGVIQASPRVLAGRPVLLVDDLYRSGVTAEAATLALLEAGSSAVRFLALTKTRRHR